MSTTYQIKVTDPDGKLGVIDATAKAVDAVAATLEAAGYTTEIVIIEERRSGITVRRYPSNAIVKVIDKLTYPEMSETSRLLTEQGFMVTSFHMDHWVFSPMERDTVFYRGYVGSAERK